MTTRAVQAAHFRTGDDVMALVLAGGRGSRLWPISTEARPKQFCSLVSEKTMLQITVERILPIVPIERIFVCTCPEYSHYLGEQLPDLPPENVILEPQGRDTTAAIAYASLVLESRIPGATVLVLSADNYVEQFEQFQKSICIGLEIAQEGDYLVSIGIVPTMAHTGYGYMECGDRIESHESSFWGIRYVEKPSQKDALAFLQAGNFLWNSGMFVWKNTTMLNALYDYQPELSTSLSRIAELLRVKPADWKAICEAYAGIPKISIDDSIMQNVKPGDRFRHVFVRGEFAWSDVGSFTAIGEIVGRDQDWNARIGEIDLGVPVTTRNSILFAETPMRISVRGVSDIIAAVNADGEAVVLQMPQGTQERETSGGSGSRMRALLNQPVSWPQGEGGRCLTCFDGAQNYIAARVKLLDVSNSIVESDRHAIIGAVGISRMAVVLRGRSLFVYSFDCIGELDEMLGCSYGQIV